MGSENFEPIMMSFSPTEYIHLLNYLCSVNVVLIGELLDFFLLGACVSVSCSRRTVDFRADSEGGICPS